MIRNPVDISLPTMSAPENPPVYDVAAGALNLKKATQYKVSMDVSATEDFSDDGACALAVRRLYADSLLKGRTFRRQKKDPY